MKFAQMAPMDRAGRFCSCGGDETSHYYSCTVFCAMMEFGNEIQHGRLIMHVLCGFAVERKNVIVQGYVVP